MPAATPPALDAHLLTLIRLAITEDLGPHRSDKTVESAIPSTLAGQGTIVARQTGTLAGTFLLQTILQEYSPALQSTLLAHDGDRLTSHQPIATITGPVHALLSAERTLLNFLGHLSGVATMTARYVDDIADIRPTPSIVDTRKTTPAFRLLDKYAVRCGGGANHRLGLYDGVMLKDNHLAALRTKLGAHQTLAQLTTTLRAQLDPAIPLWLEVDTIDQLTEALPQGGADIILLDNFTPHQLRIAVQLRNTQHSALSTQHSFPRPLLEASGGVTLHNLRDIAHTGVDRISIGAITHSAPVMDLSMEFT